MDHSIAIFVKDLFPPAAKNTKFLVSGFSGVVPGSTWTLCYFDEPKDDIKKYRNLVFSNTEQATALAYWNYGSYWTHGALNYETRQANDQGIVSFYVPGLTEFNVCKLHEDKTLLFLYGHDCNVQGDLKVFGATVPKPPNSTSPIN